VVDALEVDPRLASGANGDRIDSRVAGPFRLSRADRRELDAAARVSVTCLRAKGMAAKVTPSDSGRPQVSIIGGDPDYLLTSDCFSRLLVWGTPAERRALGKLSDLVDRCLKSRRIPTAVLLNVDLTWQKTRNLPAGLDSEIADCIESGRKTQLSEYVAPGALLFITDPSGSSTQRAVRFSFLESRRTIVAALSVFLLTLLVTVIAATRLVRPLRALTGAAQSIRAGGSSIQVDVERQDEIGELAAAFNDMSAHRDLLEAQRKAIISDVSHELRTPLSNIRGWLEATQDGFTPPSPALVSSLLDEALLLQHVIDDLQQLAVADAGDLHLDLADVRIDDLLEQAAGAHAARAHEVGVRLTTVPGSDPVIRADPVRLRQAVSNLLSNAIRHSAPHGEVTLRESIEGRELVIEVIDHGSGISAQDLPFVFDRFWRADKSRNRHTGGSGLGLAIVRKLVDAHGGSVSATSVPNEVTTFRITLPL
jgi:two-component system, OmpR family, sensor histidine kinase BaeS